MCSDVSVGALPNYILRLQCKLHCTNNKDQSNIKQACLLVCIFSTQVVTVHTSQATMHHLYCNIFLFYFIILCKIFVVLSYPSSELTIDTFVPRFSDQDGYLVG